MVYRSAKAALALSLARLRSAGKPQATLAARAEQIFLPFRKDLAGKFATDNPESRIIDNKYLATPIYEGTLSKVFAAKPLTGGPLVVIKTGSELFEHLIPLETEALKSIDLPGVVKLISSREGSDPYLAMEFIPGCTLFQLLEQGNLTRREADYLIESILKTAQSLHTAGITHNDFNYHNIMIDLDGEVKVVDFGICSIKFESEEKKLRKIQIDLLMLAKIIMEILDKLPSHPAKALVRGVVNGTHTSRTPFSSALDFITAIKRMSTLFPPAIKHV